ncbi:MAG: O-antigen ligase family protein [Candidatus Jacksonbacteria bacterium]|nr:O-antigen ligase family protein [Candidatus Jacksonbacteria bacterium]
MFNRRLFWTTLFIIASLNLLSFFAFYSPIVNWLSFILILTLAALISWRNLLWGIYILLAELMISSQGHLFDIYIGGFRLSLRMGLFAVLLVVLVLKISNANPESFRGQMPNVKLSLKKYQFYIVLGLVMVWGVINGILQNNNRGFLYQDFNGYLFFLLLPVFIAAFANQKKITGYSLRVTREFLTIWSAALVWQFAVTALLLFFYGHIDVFWRELVPLYKWFRDLRIIEVGLYKYNFHRVFMQSGIWALTGFFVFVSHLLESQKKRNRKNTKLLWLMSVCITTILLVNLSRSFWVGGAVGFIWFSYLYLSHLRPSMRQIARHILTLVMSVVASIFVIAMILLVPIGKIPGLKTLSSLTERVTETEESAVRSRKALLPPLQEGIRNHAILGAGFGAEITYKTTDPRYIAAHPNNPYYTTFAFEWGWLDVWYKLGILGLVAYIALIFSIVSRGRSAIKNCEARNAPFIIGILSGVIALAVVHFFTPFLNHPLGIGYLILADAIFRDL